VIQGFLFGKSFNEAQISTNRFKNEAQNLINRFKIEAINQSHQ
jgi:hypothetical protein